MLEKLFNTWEKEKAKIRKQSLEKYPEIEEIKKRPNNFRKFSEQRKLAVKRALEMKRSFN